MASLWPAVYALREAESLAQLGDVSGGPSDAPPDKPQDEDGWAKDWLTRAREALDKAKRIHADGVRKGSELLRDRAHRVAKHILSGVNNVLGVARNVKEDTKAALRNLAKTAGDAATGFAVSFSVGTIVLSAIALWLLKKYIS